MFVACVWLPLCIMKSFCDTVFIKMNCAHNVYLNTRGMTSGISKCSPCALCWKRPPLLMPLTSHVIVFRIKHVTYSPLKVSLNSSFCQITQWLNNVLSGIWNEKPGLLPACVFGNWDRITILQWFYGHHCIISKSKARSMAYTSCRLPTTYHWWKHDDVIKWKHFPRYWSFVWEIHRPPVNSLHKGQWRGALMFSWIYAWMNGWVNNREAGDLRRHLTHYDVIVMVGPVFHLWQGKIATSVRRCYICNAFSHWIKRFIMIQL